MRCCVPFCKIPADNVSGADEVTFHSFPTDATLRIKWLTALGKHDQPLEDSELVCSQHFLDDDFCNVEGGSRQVRSGVVPSAVKLCMICLDTDRNLVSLSKYNLEEAYEKLTGHSICREGSLKQTLCIQCAQELINFEKFRTRSLRARSAMMDLIKMHETITMQHITQIKNMREQLQSNIVKTLIAPDHCDLHITDNNNEVKQADNANNAMNVAETDAVLVDIKIEIDDPVGCERDYISDASVLMDKKVENINIECPICFKVFSNEEAYNAHYHDGRHAECDSEECDTQLAHRTHTALHSHHRDTNHVMGDDSSSDYSHITVQMVPTQPCEFLDDICKSRNVKSESKEERGASYQTPITAKACRQKPDTEKLIFQPDLSCQYCEYKCSTYKNLVKHLKNHTIDKPFSCKRCQYTSTCKSKLVNHMRTHTGEKPFSCKLCKFACNQKSNLVTHMRVHIDDKRLSCNACEYTTLYKSNLVSHMRVHIKEKPFSCNLCEYAGKSKTGLINHMKIHTDEKPFACNLCGYAGKSKTRLGNHMKIIHTDEKPFPCALCEYATIYKSNLASHMRIHTGEKPFACNTCEYTCRSKSSLVSHMKIHTNEKPFACNVCDYAGKTKCNLVNHMKIHTDEKPFACNLCGYVSKRKGSLVSHMRIHTDEKLFLCNSCEYACKQKSNLITHMRVHTGEKPFSCNTNEDAYKSDLSNH